ncbi:MAG: ketoacyl-ACP synthase III [Defluviitaleaceae bacterium]|nr:ketoacyl-ACP synthase III [Defluviitaleaceae bacterium]
MRILGTGSYLPQNKLSNEDLSKLVDTNDEWVVSRTGIKSRHLVKDENTSDLATKAAKAVLETTGVDVRDIQLVIVATSTPDVFIPGVAHQVLKNLHIPNAMAFDVNAACTGFIYALDVATSLMQTHAFKYGLIIGAEAFSKVIDWHDRNTCVLFGDGAGTVLLENHQEKNQIIYTSCTAIPDVDDVLKSGGIAVNNPFNRQKTDNFFLGMKGQEVFKFAVRVVCESVNKALVETGIDAQAVDYYVLHQANSRILDHVAKKLSVPSEKFYSTLEDTGNTSAASIPIVLDVMDRKQLLKKGMKIVLTGFGAGLTYGTILIEW